MTTGGQNLTFWGRIGRKRHSEPIVPRSHNPSPRVAFGALTADGQALARRSTITLTTDRYTHLGIVDLSAAFDGFPELPGDEESVPELNGLLATGTEGAAAQNVVVAVAVGPVPPCPELSVVGSDAEIFELHDGRTPIPQSASLKADGEGFEPPVRLPVQQFSRLPP